MAASRFFSGSKITMFSRLKPKFPDKLKGGKIEKTANYFHNILMDYKTVMKETVKAMKNRPLKASVYLSLIGTTGVLIKTNPSPQDYNENMVDYHNDLGAIGVPIRNPESVDFLHKLFGAQTDGKLRLHNLYLFTLVRFATNSAHVDLLASKCKQIKPHWTQFHKSIIDIGIFGQWVYLDKAMKDCDVNPAEWDNKSK